MKPLTNITNFLDRFDNFIDAEIKELIVLSASMIKVVLLAQDRSREFDWIKIELNFVDIFDAKLIEDKKLSLIDMSDGISIIKDGTKIAFAIGKYNNIQTIKNSIIYIESKTIKYDERSF